MSGQALFASLLLWVVLILAAITLSIDAGGSAIALWANRSGHEDASRLIERYVTPVWETSNVFVVVFAILLVGFFPGSLSFFAPALTAPLTMALVAMLVRGAAFVVAHYTDRWQRSAHLAFTGSGVIIPPLLVTFLAAADIGAGLTRHPIVLLWQPLTVALMALALTAEGSIATTFLTWHALRQGDVRTAQWLRRWAIRCAGPTVLASIALGLALHWTAPYHAASTARLGGWIVGAALFFVVHWWLLVQGRRIGIAFGALVGAVMLSLCAWEFGMWPLIAWPHLLATTALVNGTMFQALAIVLAVGTLLLLPALGVLYWLFAFSTATQPPGTDLTAEA